MNGQIYRISQDVMYAGVLKRALKKSKTIVRLGSFSSTIMACSNNDKIVVFKSTRTVSVSASAKISVRIVTTIGAFWWVSRRCADKKLFIILSSMNWRVDGLLWCAQVTNGLDAIFCIGIWNRTRIYLSFKWAVVWVQSILHISTYQSELRYPLDDQISENFLQLRIRLIVQFFNTANNQMPYFMHSLNWN